MPPRVERCVSDATAKTIALFNMHMLDGSLWGRTRFERKDCEPTSMNDECDRNLRSLIKESGEMMHCIDNGDPRNKMSVIVSACAEASR